MVIELKMDKAIVVEYIMYFIKYCSLVIYRSLSKDINKKEAPWMLSCKMSIVALTSICLLQWMFIRTSPDFRLLVMVVIKKVFGQRNVLNDRSHYADVIGNVHKIRSNSCTFGKIW